MVKRESLMTALFPDRESAELGFQALSERGYTNEDVDILMSEYAKRRYFTSGTLETGLGAKAAEAEARNASPLMGWNVPEERVRQYDEGIRAGGILMLVSPRNEHDARYFDNMWRINRAQNVAGMELADSGKPSLDPIH